MERLTRTMIRFRWAVVAVWAVVVLVSLLAMSGLSDLLTNRFSLPGTDTERARPSSRTTSDSARPGRSVSW
jgi:uncharacterized membrane protein YdfJ with MMPL/SSD domain